MTLYLFPNCFALWPKVDLVSVYHLFYRQRYFLTRSFDLCADEINVDSSCRSAPTVGKNNTGQNTAVTLFCCYMFVCFSHCADHLWLLTFVAMFSLCFFSVSLSCVCVFFCLDLLSIICRLWGFSFLLFFFFFSLRLQLLPMRWREVSLFSLSLLSHSPSFILSFRPSFSVLSQCFPESWYSAPHIKHTCSRAPCQQCMSCSNSNSSSQISGGRCACCFVHICRYHTNVKVGCVIILQ